MHELSVCQGLLAQVRRIAAEHNAPAVASIHVEVGPLSGVVPELLQTAFDVASRDSIAAGARLEISTPPVRVLCQACGEQTDSQANQLVCGACGAWQTRLLTGNELRLQRVMLSY